MGVDLMRENLRRGNPGASVAEIELLLLTWLHDRPGAVGADAAGRQPAARSSQR